MQLGPLIYSSGMATSREYVVLAALTLAIAGLVPIATIWQKSVDNLHDADLVLVLSGEWSRVSDVAAAHGGQLIAGASTPFSTLVQVTPKTVSALRAVGGWKVIPANALSFLCAPLDPKQS